MPQSPFPPFPESPPLCHESFDEEYFQGQTNSEIMISGLGFLDESWSGYALQRAGEAVTPFVVPALDAYGRTNVSSDTGGSLRFWVLPTWSSGAGTGAAAVLLEMDAASGGGTACAWSLQVSADGGTVELFTQSGAGLQEVLQAPISWLAGTPHNIVLDYGPQGTSLFLDGVLAAQGTGLASVLPSAGQLVLGSALSGANTAGADFEEFYSFGSWLTDTSVSLYYDMIAPVAALGPVSAEEQAVWESGVGAMNQNSIFAAGNVFDPDSDTCGCITNGPVFLTNMVVFPDASSNVTVSLDVQGGTNGVFYDLYTSTNLQSTFAGSDWIWLAQVLTCNTYVFSNQPANATFYFVTFPTLTAR